MSKSALVRVDGKTYAILKSASKDSDVPMTKIIKKAFGKPAKVKKVCEF